jgi:hypothetical protein
MMVILDKSENGSSELRHHTSLRRALGFDESESSPILS